MRLCYTFRISMGNWVFMIQNGKILGYLLFASLIALCLQSGEAFAQSQASGPTLGQVIRNIQTNSISLGGVFSGFSYLAGLVLGYLGIIKLKQHVENPQHSPLSASMTRFLAGGAFFALPFVMDVVRATIEDDGNQVKYTNNGFNGKVSGTGLDAMIVNLMEDIFIPLQWMFGTFGYLAGIVLVMIGISRLLKSEQDGPRGPGGIGTIMTFLMAGCLFSINSIIGYLNNSLFMDDTIKTKGVLQYTAGLGGAADHVHAVISAIIAFSVILGWISLIRGFFIIRGVSEGNSQASMMAAVTHVIGGVLAINLGSVIMAVQDTLGITAYGIKF